MKWGKLQPLILVNIYIYVNPVTPPYISDFIALHDFGAACGSAHEAVVHLVHGNRSNLVRATAR